MDHGSQRASVIFIFDKFFSKDRDFRRKLPSNFYQVTFFPDDVHFPAAPRRAQSTVKWDLCAIVTDLGFGNLETPLGYAWPWRLAVPLGRSGCAAAGMR